MKGQARKMQRGLGGIACGLQKGLPTEVAARIRDVAERNLISSRSFYVSGHIAIIPKIRVNCTVGMHSEQRKVRARFVPRRSDGDDFPILLHLNMSDNVIIVVGKGQNCHSIDTKLCIRRAVIGKLREKKVLVSPRGIPQKPSSDHSATIS
jgi:hypothetical protein